MVVHNSPETQPGGRALKFYASQRLDIRRIETLKEGTEAVGNRVRVKVVKNKVAAPFRQAEFDIEFGLGISTVGCLLDLGIEHNVVQKSGSFFSYGDERLGQGRNNAKGFLDEHQEIAARDRGGRSTPRSASARTSWPRSSTTDGPCRGAAAGVVKASLGRLPPCPRCRAARSTPRLGQRRESRGGRPPRQAEGDGPPDSPRPAGARRREVGCSARWTSATATSASAIARRPRCAATSRLQGTSTRQSSRGRLAALTFPGYVDDAALSHRRSPKIAARSTHWGAGRSSAG